MTRKLLTYYTLKPIMNNAAPDSLHYQEQKNELYMSPNLRLCSSLKEAHIDSLPLAQRFVEAIMPTLQKRYGNEFDLEILECSTMESKRTIERIRKDSEIIEKRIETNNFAGNVAP